jgi:ABC-type phosphate transport system ATPase subunit
VERDLKDKKREEARSSARPQSLSSGVNRNLSLKRGISVKSHCTSLVRSLVGSNSDRNRTLKIEMIILKSAIKNYTCKIVEEY